MRVKSYKTATAKISVEKIKYLESTPKSASNHVEWSDVILSVKQ